MRRVDVFRGRLLAAGALAAAGCAADEPPPEETSESEQAMTVCAEDVVHGIDVSYYQGSVDWAAVKGGGYDFAIARINHSSFMDPEFDANWAGIKSVGMIRGAYQYFEPGEDVAWQAQVVVDKLGKLGPGDLPAVIDVETHGGLPNAQVAQAVGEWLLLVEEGTGKKPIIYTGKYFWQDNVGSAEYASYPLWHAQYPNACQPPNDPPPACGCANIADQWSDFVVWQYSSSGSVPGISGNVDLNVFKGTYEDLVAFASQGGYAGELVSIDVPGAVLAGETFTARVTLRNTGNAPWDAATHLGTTEPRDHASAFHDPSWPSQNRAAAVTGTVEAGAEHTFEFTMRAPAEQGTFTEHFGLVQEGVAWFGDQGGPPDDAVRLVVQVVGSSGTQNPANGSGAGGAGGEGGGADGAGDGDGSCECAAPARPGRGAWWLAVASIAAAALVRRRARSIR